MTDLDTIRAMLTKLGADPHEEPTQKLGDNETPTNGTSLFIGPTSGRHRRGSYGANVEFIFDQDGALWAVWVWE